MSIRDCLSSAVEQGAINQRQADELEGYFNERFKKGADAKAARDAVSEDLRQMAARKRRNAKLAQEKRAEIADYLKTHLNYRGKKDLKDGALNLFVHYGTGGRTSIAGKRDAIMSLVMRDLTDAMEQFRRSAGLGRRINQADLPDLIKELFGEPSGRPEFRAMADAIRNATEDMRQRFNAAGGVIPARKGYDLPHSHDAAKIRKLGATPEEQRLAWKKIIRPLIDPEQMTNPRTGEVIGAGGIDESLDYVFDTIMSDGAAHLSPQARAAGQGSIANKYKDGRFLEFKDADSWLKYNEQFGNSDPIGAIFSHYKNIANDIAFMEVLGPNPAATVEWLKQVLEHEFGKAIAGKSLLVDKVPSIDAGKRAAYRVDSLYKAMRGRETAWNAPAEYAADVRNIATSAMLGATGILAAATDPIIAAASRSLAGMPISTSMNKLVREMAKDAKGAKGAAAAQRRAILWDDYMNVLNEEARLVDQLHGHSFSKYIVDRSLTYNGLKPLTAARKRIEAGAWHETLGGYAQSNTDWMDLPKLLKRAMEGFGLTADDWHKMRAGVDDIGFLDPGGVLDKTGDLALAEKYSAMIIGWNERSVPSGDIRIKSALQGISPRGTITGELVDFATQFMSFGLSFTARQLEAIYMFSMAGNPKWGRIGQAGRGAGYFAAMSVSLMFGAAAYNQIKAIADGKDPEDMTDPKFWVKSFVQGGGGGLFADFVSKSESRFGQSFQESISGPGVAFVSDSVDLTIGSIMRILQGDDAKLGRKASNYLGRYTPVLSSHPATRLIYRRMLIDNLQWLTDPDAEKSFQAKKRRATYFVPPGEGITPQRAPNFATMRGQ